MVLLLSKPEVESLLTASEALGAVEEAFRAHALGQVLMPSRAAFPLAQGKGWTGIMPAYMENLQALTVKLVTSFPENPKSGYPTVNALLIYSDPSTGLPLAVMEAGFLTSLRTGAAGGVAVKYLARRDAGVLGLLGAGEQAWRQLESVRLVRNLKKVKVYSPNPQHRRRFAQQAAESFGVEVKAVDTAEEAAVNSDIVVLATTSKVPVLRGDWVEEGAHLNAFGAHTPETRELDGETVVKAKIVVDSKEACLREAGDLLIPLAQGLIRQTDIHAELGEVVAGLKEGRSSDREVTLFKSVGLAFQDAAVAKVVYEKALKLGVGKEWEIL
ncbi:ornithine cyclodeaminase family protein [Candidatus Hecatella orcuttiae]|uniref:ornithine cyclodeaminase family protein n=1 Tax=Candidatus Hecatella orcuttiae TaxID=1935119 RepID=UPI002867D5E2|nr:ornithine cyclodeaminase family protein [Candidatus Hecatella orcuttiae]